MTGYASERGFSVLEILIIVVVVCSVVAIGVPMLHRGANTVVLDSNVQSLGSLVSEQVIDGYSPEYRASGDGDPRTYLSLALEQTLTEPGATIYTNPFVGKNAGTQVINSKQVPFGSGFVAPGVLITDSIDCQYGAFPNLPLGLRRLLVGTLIVAFNGPGGTVDVYFVDQHGKGSMAIVSVPTAQVRAGRHG